MTDDQCAFGRGHMSQFNIRGMTDEGLAVTGFCYRRPGHAAKVKTWRLKCVMSSSGLRTRSVAACNASQFHPLSKADFQIIEAKVLGRWVANTAFMLTGLQSIHRVQGAQRPDANARYSHVNVD
jgi:hypothetical protein